MPTQGEQQRALGHTQRTSVTRSEPWDTHTDQQRALSTHTEPQRTSANHSDPYTNILHKGRRPEVCQPRVSDSEPWVFKKNEKKTQSPKNKKIYLCRFNHYINVIG